MPKPCSGPSPSIVLSTISASVPCQTSALSRASIISESQMRLHAFLWEYNWKGPTGGFPERRAPCTLPVVDLVGDLTLVLAAALAGGFIAHRLRQPLIVGYILAGIVVGPFTGGVHVRHAENIESLAELGVALLLFSLGLEVSLRELAPLRAVALAGTTIQMAVTIALGVALAEGL